MRVSILAAAVREVLYSWWVEAEIKRQGLGKKLVTEWEEEHE